MRERLMHVIHELDKAETKRAEKVAAALREVVEKAEQWEVQIFVEAFKA